MVLNPESRILNPAVAAAINHLLRAASWARDELKPFAGRTARFEVAPLVLSLTVVQSAEVTPAAPDAIPAVTIMLTPGLMLRLAARDEAAWREIQFAGDADFGAAINRVARNLRWDVEEDLSRVLGDTVAHRMAETGRTLRRWGEEAAENTGRAFAEYWTEEQPLIAGARELEEFSRAVDQLRDAAARFEKRLDHLTTRQAAIKKPG